MEQAFLALTGAGGVSVLVAEARKVPAFLRRTF